MRPRSRSTSPNLTSSSPGRGEVLVGIKAAGLCHSDLSVIDGSRPRPDPNGARPRSGGGCRGFGRRGDRPEGRRSRRARLRAELRPLRPMRGGTPRALRAGGRGERRRNAAFRRAAAFVPGRADQPPAGRLGVCNPRGGGARIVREDRPRPAARARRPVRLRGADRGWRGRQHRESRTRPIGRGGGPGRRGPQRRPRREARRRASDRRGRFIGRQARFRH